MIIRGYKHIKAHYPELQRGDVLIGRIPENPLKKAMLVDLLEKGVACLPSALSQVISRSKAAQALVYSNWMIPGTIVISRRADLIQAMTEYRRKAIDKVVTKEDHKHCGHGIRRWDSIEMVYNTIAFAKDAYPFVLQPYLDKVIDARVILIGDYEEAYERRNPNNFRQNIAVGGYSASFDLDATVKSFCREVMNRGKFPYAHIDLLIAEDGIIYLSEIALDGGIKGARITRRDILEKKRIILERLAETLPQSVSAA